MEEQGRKEGKRGRSPDRQTRRRQVNKNREEKEFQNVCGQSL